MSQSGLFRVVKKLHPQQSVFEQSLAREAVGDRTRTGAGSSTTAIDGEVAIVFNAKEI